MNDTILADSAPDKGSITAPISAANATATVYTFLRHIGFMLDELSAQGLILWLDDEQRWRWRWQETDLTSSQGFWAMGEALVDAVVGRYPEAFSATNR